MKISSTTDLKPMASMKVKHAQCEGEKRKINKYEDLEFEVEQISGRLQSECNTWHCDWFI